MTLKLSVNVNLLFAEEAEETTGRVAAAAAAGCMGIEIWEPSRCGDLAELARALADTGTELVSMVVEPRTQLMFGPREAFLDAVRASVDIAAALSCPRLVTTPGIGNPGMRRTEQHAVVIDALSEASALLQPYRLPSGRTIELTLENLNTRVDHPGSLLDHTLDCIEIVRQVRSPHLRLLFDRYHSIAMGEELDVLVGHVGVVSHVQVADHPGRGPLGTGTVDWARELRHLAQLGYAGFVGLECDPAGSSSRSAVSAASRLLADAGAEAGI